MFEPSKEISVHVMAKDVIWGIPHHFGRVLGVLPTLAWTTWIGGSFALISGILFGCKPG